VFSEEFQTLKSQSEKNIVTRSLLEIDQGSE